MSVAMDAFLGRALWPITSAGEALEVLAQRHGLVASDSALVSGAFDEDNADAWLDWAGQQIGIETLPAQAKVRELPAFLMHGGPALIRVDAGERCGTLALTGARRGTPAFLCPDGSVASAGAANIAAILYRNHAEKLMPEVARIVAAAGVSDERTSSVSSALIAERIGGEDVTGLTMLRLPPDADFLQQFRHARLPWRLAQIVGLFVLLYGAELWSWSLIGGATLSGRLDWGWLTAWLLLAFTMMPGHLLAGWNEAVFGLETGRLVKSRLLAGALALPPDSVKRQGVGALIGKVMESQALEGLALGGAFSVLVGLIELGFAFWVLGQGAAPVLHGSLLCGFAVLTVLMAGQYHRRIIEWTRDRLGMTDYLIEAMIGHRTRLAQERADRRDLAEDGQLVRYQGKSAAMDRTALRFGSGLASAWLIAAILALGPSVARSPAPSGVLLAISLGGVMLAQRALGAVGSGLSSLSRASFAWEQVRTIFQAGKRTAPSPSRIASTEGGGSDSGPVLEGQNIAFAHEEGHKPVLSGVDFTINAGDRILMEGPSGGGKSTLANLLTGLRKADNGLLLLDGLDRHTIGNDWHGRVTSAPQFHDNHILSGTLAFNLLMGRQWPPSVTDLKAAEQMCERLDLGDLLRKMPGGLHQQVGETGWQLSHGERSRVFLARALLQKAQVTILDESFASLDPATMDRCLTTALEEAETLVVIAHP
ncbi:ABC transporter ATP-binding protein [Novosphingobium sp. ERN07]|uniref:ATP-binding cassette domain-containing protein n=1 Tax=Novosphingobium sp. ERN07 TaxID=2726187 RepID=UPI00145707CA|nr:ABC transporter ATP-binding protein [Novosphingobium sp. ERN07]NLR70034.1 ABC transporter ATP-binding protein [Novosphingobium sp. ERN07]